MKRHAKMSSRVTLRDKSGGVIGVEDKDTDIAWRKFPVGASIGYVRVGDVVKLSQDFHSVGVEISVEAPWPMRPGSREDVLEGLTFVGEIVDKELSRKARELPDVLRRLSHRRK